MVNHGHPECDYLLVAWSIRANDEAAEEYYARRYLAAHAQLSQQVQSNTFPFVLQRLISKEFNRKDWKSVYQLATQLENDWQQGAFYLAMLYADGEGVPGETRDVAKAKDFATRALNQEINDGQKEICYTILKM